MIDVAFLDHLANARSKIEFARTAAGFAALKLYDSVKTHGYDPAIHRDALHQLERDVTGIADEASVHAALESVVQALPFWGCDGATRIGRRAVYTALLVYGQALGDEGEWQIAESVYSIVGMDAELDGETWLAAEARLLMGRASRMCADWEASGIAYRRAYELGTDAGDLSIALRARIGEANNLWSRGDFPAARQLLNATARRARASCPAVLPRVVLAIAGVANAAGEYERAIHLAFGLLHSLSDNDELKYKILVDLAAFLTDYGLPSVAAAALRLVESAAPEPHVRRHAKLNLFFLAARHNDEAAFTALRLALANEPLTPRQQTQYALFAAQGFRRFLRLDSALASVERAIQLATQFQLFQLVFEAEAELHAIQAVGTDLHEEGVRQARHSRRARARAAGGSDDGTDVIEATFDTSITRDKIPPRIRQVAESLESMAAGRFAIGAERGMSAAL